MSYEGQDDLITLSIERRHKFEAPTPIPSPRRTAKAVVSATMIFLGFGGIFFGSLLTPLTLYSGYKTYDALHTWPRADAEIKACEVYSELVAATNGPESSTTSSRVYGFRCTVRYSADSISARSTSLPDPAETTSTGTRNYQSVADIGYQSSNRGNLARWSERFYEGRHTTIIYQPSDPTRIRFAGDLDAAYTGPIRAVLIAAGLLFVSLLIFILGRKLRPQQEIS
jgi:Protein of unknown function (DUF3592)